MVQQKYRYISKNYKPKPEPEPEPKPETEPEPKPEPDPHLILKNLSIKYVIICLSPINSAPFSTL